MDVSITINNGSSNSELYMTGASEKSEATIIAGFFDQMGAAVQTEPIKLSGEPIATGEEKKLATGIVKSPRIKISKPFKSSEEINKVVKDNLDKMIDKALRPERARQLPLVGQESRSVFPISEAAKVKTVDEPEHWKTGIKVDDDGTKRYKCRYHCECGNKTNVYIEPDWEFVTCRECGEDLFIETATTVVDNEGIPDRDAFGNFFVAGNLVQI